MSFGPAVHVTAPPAMLSTPPELVAPVLGTVAPPAGKAMYEEGQRALMGHEEDLAFRSSALFRNYRMAMNSGDQEAIQAATNAIMEHDQANPSMSISPTLGTNITQPITQRAEAMAMGLPMGYNAHDWMFNQKVLGAFPSLGQ